MKCRRAKQGFRRGVWAGLLMLLLGACGGTPPTPEPKLTLPPTWTPPPSPTSVPTPTGVPAPTVDRDLSSALTEGYAAMITLQALNSSLEETARQVEAGQIPPEAALPPVARVIQALQPVAETLESPPPMAELSPLWESARIDLALVSNIAQRWLSQGITSAEVTALTSSAGSHIESTLALAEGSLTAQAGLSPETLVRVRERTRADVRIRLTP